MGRRGRSIALGAAVAAVLTVPLVVTVTAQATTDVLLSTGRPATASSIEASRYAAGNAVDGAGRTRWARAEGAGSQWLRIDLGRAQAVSRVRLVWEAAYARAYRVQVSPPMWYECVWEDYVFEAGDGRWLLHLGFSD